MNKPDDGHSPATCNYRRCAATDPKGPCPFVADEKPAPVRLGTLQCVHDWRQLWGSDGNYSYPIGFYCTKCLLHHDRVSG